MHSQSPTILFESENVESLITTIATKTAITYLIYCVGAVVSQNGASHNGASHNGASHNGASHNGASHNGASHNGASYNGVSQHDHCHILLLYLT